MKIGIKSSPGRGVVTIRGFIEGQYGLPTKRTLLDLRLVPLERVQALALDEHPGDPSAEFNIIADRCDDFVHELRHLMQVYGIELHEEG